MRIRIATMNDLPQLLAIYAGARERMKQNGNPSQWGDSRPSRERIEQDIQSGVCRVIEQDSRPCGVFALVPGPEPTYAAIDGQWLNDAPYAVLHRVASDGRVHGVMRAILRYSALLYPNLRIDTHADNAVMQHAILQGGFQFCGVIRVEDGSPRLAYQRTVRVPACCCFGSLNMDHVYRVSAFLNAGETRAAQSLSHVCGGKGLNQAIALASGGLSVRMAGNVGDNAEGERLCAALQARGVSSELVRRLPDTDCGHAVIQVADNGENCILLYGGANEQVDDAQIAAVLPQFRAGDLLILQNEINRLPELMRAARARGMQIVLNPSPFNARITEELLKMSDILFVNAVEAQQLVDSEASGEAAGALLHARYPHLLLIETLGGQGAVAWQGDAVCRQPVFPVEAVDTTGAGDTFTGFFLAAYAKGLPLQACLELASKAAALCVTRLGASAAIPTLDEVLESPLA